MSELQRVPAPAPGLFVRELDGETSIITPAGDRLDTLDPVGTFIWRRIDGRTTLAAIADAVCAEYDSPRDIVAADLVEFVGKLVDRGLVTLSAPR